MLLLMKCSMKGVFLGMRGTKGTKDTKGSKCAKVTMISILSNNASCFVRFVLIKFLNTMLKSMGRIDTQLSCLNLCLSLTLYNEASTISVLYFLVGSNLEKMWKMLENCQGSPKPP